MNDIVFKAAVIAFMRDWYYWGESQTCGGLSEQYRQRGDNLHKYGMELYEAVMKQVGEREAE